MVLIELADRFQVKNLAQKFIRCSARMSSQGRQTRLG